MTKWAKIEPIAVNHVQVKVDQVFRCFFQHREFDIPLESLFFRQRMQVRISCEFNRLSSFSGFFPENFSLEDYWRSAAKCHCEAKVQKTFSNIYLVMFDYREKVVNQMQIIYKPAFSADVVTFYVRRFHAEHEKLQVVLF